MRLKPAPRRDPSSTANMLLCDVLGQLRNPIAVNAFLKRTYGIDFRAVERSRQRAQAEIDAKPPQSTSKHPSEPRKRRP